MCNITVEPVIGIGIPLTSLRIVGTVDDCAEPFEGAQVEVAISCDSIDGEFTSWTGASSLSPGNWEIIFPIQDESCRCGGTVFVTARCVTDEECVVPAFSADIQCIECPIISLAGIDDDVGPQPVRWKCNSDGSVSVTIDIEIENTTSRFIEAELDCGPDGVPEQKSSIGITPGGIGTFTNVCRYPTPISPKPVVSIFLGQGPDREPSGCPPFVVPVDSIPECQPPEDCPEILEVQIRVQECVRDENDGQVKRKVKFIPDWWGPTPISHQWHLGNGDIVPQMIPVGGNGPPSELEYLYVTIPASDPSLCIYGPDGCASCLTIPLSDFIGFQMCECPEIVDVNVNIGECLEDPSDNKTKRKVTFTPILSGPTPDAYEWLFGDGETDFGSGVPGPTEHLYENAPTIEPVLKINSGEPCQEESQNIPLSEFDSFSPCEGGGDDDDDDGFDWPDFLCKSLLLLALLALLAAAAFALSAGCAGIFTPPAKASLIASAVAFSAALGFLLLWWWLCSDLDCQPLNDMITFLSYLVIISALVSMILIFSGNPCGLGGLLGSVYIGIFLGVAVWIGKKTGCYGPLDSD